MINLLNSTREIWESNNFFWQMNCMKKKEWKYEKEWRFISYNMNPFCMIQSPYCKIGKLEPTAIYLGEKISEYDEKALVEIAKSKKIKYKK